MLLRVYATSVLLSDYADQRLASEFPKTNRLNPPHTKLPRAKLLAICACIFVIALSVRLLYWQDNYAGLLDGKRTGLQTMSSFYYDQAQRIIDDGGILFPHSSVDPGDATVLIHPPGYSILMAAMSRRFMGKVAGSYRKPTPRSGLCR